MNPSTMGRGVDGRGVHCALGTKGRKKPCRSGERGGKKKADKRIKRDVFANVEKIV